jgi:2-keto-3-deoxy-L-rhamnonate aldolase RhmA
MKTPALDRLRRKLKAREPLYGLWCTLGAANVAEIAATLGLDWITVDMEHGHQDWGQVLEHARAVRGSETAVFVRVPEIHQSAVKRALDLGVHGVILPLVRTRADLELGMSFGRYPTAGVRGVGGERAVKWGLAFREYLSEADQQTLIIPMIETRSAAENIESLLGVPGLELIFFGPADLSASYGHLGAWEGPHIDEVILKIRAQAEKRGIGAGIIGMDAADISRRREQGFNLIGLGSDAGLIIRSANAAFSALGVTPTPHVWF